MELWQKEFIKKNLSNLIEYTTCDAKLCAILIEKEVLSDSDVECLKVLELKSERAYKFYELLQTRNSSFDILLEALETSTQTGAVEILKRCKNPRMLLRRNSSERSFATAKELLSSILKILESIPTEDETFYGQIVEVHKLEKMLDKVQNIFSQPRTRCDNGIHEDNEAVNNHTFSCGLSVNILQPKDMSKIFQTSRVPDNIKFVTKNDDNDSDTDAIITVKPIDELNMETDSATDEICENTQILQWLATMILSTNEHPFAALTKSSKRKIKETYDRQLAVELNKINQSYKRIPIHSLASLHQAISGDILDHYSKDSTQHSLVKSYLKKCFQKKILGSNQISVNIGMREGPILGVDLGTNSTLAAASINNKIVAVGKSVCGDLNIPSFVQFDGKGKASICKYKQKSNAVYDIKHLLGKGGTDKLLENDLNTWPFAILNVGETLKLRMLEKDYFPEEILAVHLRQMCQRIQKSELNEREIQNVILSVPNMFNSRQRAAILNSAQIAGLSNCEIVNDGTAIMLSFAQQVLAGRKNANREIKVQKYISVSFGAGCLSTSLAEVDFENLTIQMLAHSGSGYLGGRNIDHKLIRHCLEKLVSNGHKIICVAKENLRNLMFQCEDVKERLGATQEEPISVDFFLDHKLQNVNITKAEVLQYFEPVVDSATSAIADLLESAELEAKNVDKIILFGGMSRLSQLKERINEKFSDKIVDCSDVLNQSLIANGAAIYGLSNMKSRKENTSFRILSEEVLPFHVGAQIVGGSTLKPFSIIVNRNTRIPFRRKCRHRIQVSPETLLLLYQSEVSDEPKKYLVGKFHLFENVCPEQVRESEFVEMEIIIDIYGNGLFQVQVCYDVHNERKAFVLQNELSLREEEKQFLVNKMIRNYS